MFYKKGLKILELSVVFKMTFAQNINYVREFFYIKIFNPFCVLFSTQTF